MAITWTVSQKQRLRELNADPGIEEVSFCNVKERDSAFHHTERLLVEQSKQNLLKLRNASCRPALCELEATLVDVLIENEFVQVVTPITLARGLLEKMSVTKQHPLFKQVFWIEENRCLRPMLAPNLYYLLRELVRVWEKPIRIFEVGPCFRRDSGGRYHLNEFTMLNLVELGLPEKRKHKRLKELVALVMGAAGVKTYQLNPARCEVYRKTIDIVAGVEVGSAVIGPHTLDEQWGIVDPWIGIGFGLERLVMVRKGYRNIQRAGRALAYLDGVRLNIK